MSLDPTACSGGMPPRRADLRAGKVGLSYLEWEAPGTPLVLLHGITSNARAWWRVGPVLAARGYHVYALDLPGHGLSDETDDHRISSIAGLVGTAATELGLDGYVLIGHSWGGAITLALAAAAPPGAAPAQVVLIDPLLKMTPDRGADAPRYMEGLGLPPEQNWPQVRANNPSWHECDVYWKGESLQQCRPAAVRGAFAASGTWDLTPELSSIAVPLLLLVAGPPYSIISAEALPQVEQALRPGLGQLAVVPGTDHNMLRGGFDLTMPVLTAWLEQHAG